MAERGRVLIRPSGTEPLVRVMLEGKELDVITKLAERTCNSDYKRMG